MRRLYVVAIAVLALALPAAASASPIVYRATLSGLQENPLVVSPGTGVAEIIVDAAAHSLSVDITFSGLLGNTTASHIHCCQFPPTTAPVATETPSFSGFPLGVQSGTYFHIFDTTLVSTYNPSFITSHGGTVTQAEAGLLAGLAAGQAYLNIHTSLFTSGEIRGQLTPVPEPASMLLLASGLAGASVRRWRERRTV